MRKVLAYLFIALYGLVGVVSTYHSITFFSMANELWAATSLAVAFEIGMISLLIYMLISKTKKKTAWFLMAVLTIVQIFANLTSSYMYMDLNNPTEIKYFTDTVLFMFDNSEQTNRVIVSYIIGAILPIVSLGMTDQVVEAFGLANGEKKKSSRTTFELD